MLVVDVVAQRLGGLCPTHFAARACGVIDGAMVVVDGRERVVVKTLRGSRNANERAGRRRAKRTGTQRDRARLVAACAARATTRLKRLVPELYEILLADERAKAGLDHWTIERAAAGGDVSWSLEWLKTYSASGDLP